MFCEVAAWAEILNLFHFVPSDLRFLSEGIDLLKDKQALQRLTEAAEKAKMELSGVQEAWTKCRMHMNAICMTVDDHVANLKRSLAFLRVNPYCLWWLTHAADICRICRPFFGGWEGQDLFALHHRWCLWSQAHWRELVSCKVRAACEQAHHPMQAFWGEVSSV